MDSAAIITYQRIVRAKLRDHPSPIPLGLDIDELSELLNFNYRNKKISRPQNQWVLYRKASKTRMAETKNNVAGDSATIAARWKKEPAEVTQFFEWLAEVCKEAHSTAFPQYEFQQKSQRRKKVKKGKSKQCPSVLASKQSRPKRLGIIWVSTVIFDPSSGKRPSENVAPAPASIPTPSIPAPSIPASASIPAPATSIPAPATSILAPAPSNQHTSSNTLSVPPLAIPSPVYPYQGHGRNQKYTSQYELLLRKFTPQVGNY